MEYVELLLDAERPCVREWIVLHPVLPHVKVSGRKEGEFDIRPADEGDDRGGVIILKLWDQEEVCCDR